MERSKRGGTHLDDNERLSLAHHLRRQRLFPEPPAPRRRLVLVLEPAAFRARGREALGQANMRGGNCLTAARHQQAASE